MSHELIKILEEENEELWKKNRPAEKHYRLKGTKFIKKSYKGWDFSNIVFEGFLFEDCDFSGCTLEETHFNKCILDRITFYGIEITTSWAINNSELFDCSFKGVASHKLNCHGTYLERCNFSASTFIQSNFNSCDVYSCDFSTCNLRKSEFANSVLWDNSILDGTTNLDQTVFHDTYDVVNDHSETIKYKNCEDRWLNWKRIHFISAFPVFGIAWASFVFSVLLVNFIHYLNGTEFIEAINYPVHVPHRIGYIILSSISLGIAAAIYKIKCPDFLQNFTESQWVYEHKHPRPRYFVESLSHKRYRRICMVLLAIGGGGALWLVGERLFSAILYLI